MSSNLELWLQAILRALRPHVENRNDALHQFSVELDALLRDQFAFVMEPRDREFVVEFSVATFLSPEFRRLVSLDQEQAVKVFLEGMF